MQDDGTRPFARWFETIDVQAALKVRTSIARLEMGNFSKVKSVGQGVSESKIDFGPGYRVYFGGNTNLERDVHKVVLTRDFKETVLQRAVSDPEFRVGLLTEAAECLLNNEVAIAKSLLRDYVNATIGFEELANRTEKKPQSLMRMLSRSGNPSLQNISQLIATLHEYEGVELHVVAG